MQRIISRKATDSDFISYWGRTPPREWLAWIGMAAEEIDWVDPKKRFFAFGGLYWSQQGVAIGFFDRRRALPALFVHREAQRFLNILKEVGEPVIYTICDTNFKLAAKWLTVLGFSRVPDRDDDLWMRRF